MDNYQNQGGSQALAAQYYWEKRFQEVEARLSQLEKHIRYPDNEVAMKEAAARAQATAEYEAARNMHAPVLNDTQGIRDLANLARRLLNPEDFGHAVTFEVRQAARRALGLPEVKEYDL